MVNKLIYLSIYLLPLSLDEVEYLANKLINNEIKSWYIMIIPRNYEEMVLKRQELCQLKIALFRCVPWTHNVNISMVSWMHSYISWVTSKNLYKMASHGEIQLKRKNHCHKEEWVISIVTVREFDIFHRTVYLWLQKGGGVALSRLESPKINCCWTSIVMIPSDPLCSTFIWASWL